MVHVNVVLSIPDPEPWLVLSKRRTRTPPATRSPAGASPSESAPAAEHRVGRAAGPPAGWDEMIESLHSAGAVSGGMAGYNLRRRAQGVTKRQKCTKQLDQDS